MRGKQLRATQSLGGQVARLTLLTLTAGSNNHSLTRRPRHNGTLKPLSSSYSIDTLGLHKHVPSDCILHSTFTRLSVLKPRFEYPQTTGPIIYMNVRYLCSTGTRSYKQSDIAYLAVPEFARGRHEPQTQELGSFADDRISLHTAFYNERCVHMEQLEIVLTLQQQRPCLLSHNMQQTISNALSLSPLLYS